MQWQRTTQTCLQAYKYITGHITEAFHAQMRACIAITFKEPFWTSYTGLCSKSMQKNSTDCRLFNSIPTTYDAG
jgi:hypothetical protein